MQVGVFLNQYHGGAFAAADLLEQAERMEALGFDSAAVGERHLHREGVVEPLTALAAIGARTERLTLATAALLPALSHPLRLAEQLAGIDRLSDGRLTFGAALGYRERELDAFDVGMDERVGRFIESFEATTDLLGGETVTREGADWALDEAFVSPAPAGEVPTWIGAHADAAIERAAYRADGWIASASSTTADLEAQIDTYEAALEEFGKDRADNDVVLMRDCFVADSLDAAREAVEPHLLTLYEWYARWGQTYVDERDVAIDWDELEEKFVIGSPEQCVEQLRAYASMGVDHVLLRCQFPGQSQAATLECLERLGEEVLPV